MGLQMREALISGAFAFFVTCWFAVCEAQVGAANGSPPKLSTLFYGHSCPGLEQVVSSTMARYLGQDISSGAPLLRMFFHDCAVNVSHNSRHTPVNQVMDLQSICSKENPRVGNSAPAKQFFPKEIMT